MCLVNENTVNAEFFKGHDIILPGLVVQLVEPLLDRLLCALQLLDREVVTSISFELSNAFQHLIELLLQNSPLSLNGHGDLLKLAVPDNHRVIVTGCDPAAELLSVLGLEVFLRCHEDVRRGIELQILACPLFCQVIRNDKQALLAEPQPFTFLRCRNHFKGLSSPHDVRQQCVAAVEDMGNGIDLVRSERDLGVDAHKAHVAAVVLSRTCAVELFIVEPCQLFAPVRIIPNPVGKSLLDQLLLSLSDCCFLLIEYSRFLAVLVLDIVEDPHVLKVERLFHNLIAVDAARTIGVIRFDIRAVVGFTLHVPFARVLREVNMDVPLAVPRCVEQVKHELLCNLRRKPGRTESDRNLACSQVNGLYSLQRSHILGIILRIELCAAPRPFELLADIAGKVFIGREILRPAVIVARVHGIQEDNSLQVLKQLLFTLAGQFHHIGHVDLGFFSK